jgi:DNA polymerase
VEPAEMMLEIAKQVSTCQKCQLHFSRKKSVPGEGPIDATIMLIGEGPGFYENEQGIPFVGPSGKYLDELLQKGGVSRPQVFIANVVKCRPPNNRDPLPEELLACSEYLDKQIALINPKIIITLGRFSMAKFLPTAKISEAHGRPVWVRDRLIVPMFHPAAALHQASLKATIEADFARLPELLKTKPPASSAFTPEKVSSGPSIGARPVMAAQPPVQPDLLSMLLPTEEPIKKDEPQPPSNGGQPTQLSLF